MTETEFLDLFKHCVEKELIQINTEVDWRYAEQGDGFWHETKTHIMVNGHHIKTIIGDCSIKTENN